MSIVPATCALSSATTTSVITVSPGEISPATILFKEAYATGEIEYPESSDIIVLTPLEMASALEWISVPILLALSSTTSSTSPCTP